MNTEQNKLPLWKELNEKRTKGHLISFKNNDEYIVHTAGDRPHKFTHHCKESETITIDEAKANAQYTALAVNNFAQVCEALEQLVNRIDNNWAAITSGTQNGTKEALLKEAKQVLNNIK